jgi:hypothetical protein
MFDSLYPKTVSYYREGMHKVAGTGGYFGDSRTITLLFSGSPAPVQAPSIGTIGSEGGRLPNDAPGPVKWSIFPPGQRGAKKWNRFAILLSMTKAPGTRQDQAASARWAPLGEKARTIRLGCVCHVGRVRRN